MLEEAEHDNSLPRRRAIDPVIAELLVHQRELTDSIKALATAQFAIQGQLVGLHWDVRFLLAFLLLAMVLLVADAIGADLSLLLSAADLVWAPAPGR